jgi:threonine efflux protein
VFSTVFVETAAGFFFGNGINMIDFVPILKLVPILTVASISPGPNFMLTSSLALSEGRMAGVKASFGFAVGGSVYAALCLFGLGVVFAAMQNLLAAIKICGGMYLLYLGAQLWRSSLKPMSEKLPALASRQRHHPFIAGLFTILTNQKSIAFYAGVFALIMPKDANLPTQLALIATDVCITVLWYGLVSFCLSAPAMRTVYMRWSQWIDRVCGTFLAFFGARLLLSFKS